MPPNIIFIIADDLGWNDIGYHNPMIMTPNIDNLAMTGVRLNNSYVAQTCVPSRSMFMTGRHAIQLGLPENYIHKLPRCMPLDEVTIAQKLKESGYSTHLVGKWHLGFYKEECLPHNRGFDSFFGYVSAKIDYYHYMFGGKYDLRRNDENVALYYAGNYSTHLFSKEAEDIILNHNTKKPLYLYLAYTANHGEIEVPVEYENIYEDDVNSRERRMLFGVSSCLDEGVGKVIETLKKKGLYENSVIVFTSDNGGTPSTHGSNWPLKGKKITLWEGGVRAAGFVHSPLLNNEVRGTVMNDLFHATDWFPTFVHLAGGNVDDGTTKPLYGINQWEAISQGTKSKRTEVLINILNKATFDRDFETYQRAAIRDGDWKLLTGCGEGEWYKPDEFKTGYIPHNYEKGSSVQLYNIADDPLEEIDLYKHRRDIGDRLLARLKHLQKTIAAPPPNQTEPKICHDDSFLGPWA
ncbi:arylsulfatase J-like [Glandiceps talaboti]